MHELGAPWLSSAVPFLVPVFAQEKGRERFPGGLLPTGRLSGEKPRRSFLSTDSGFSLLSHYMHEEGLLPGS